MPVHVKHFPDNAGKKDYTKKVEADLEDGGDINCPIREIAVAVSKGQGKSDILSTPLCTNDCIAWHSGCALLGGKKPEELFGTG